ncbi:MAG: type II secretion system protein N [Gammaproteobacteria bacterium]|nr:type II secretion system protein N [Gammaproteobacteria bacterium]MDH4253880.1 type II secretion system protein N [Gammaproteobacteria bacterium]MDH5309807.1 type II secretion system protein N [Gammaproteobacteria bacterium]
MLNRRNILLAATVFVAGLIALFPARVAYHVLAPSTVRLAGIEGSIWSGRVSEGQVMNVYLRDLRWTLRPLDLFRGRLMYRFSVDPAGGFLDGDAGVSVTGRLILQDVEGGIAIGALQQVVATPGIEGNVRLQLAEFVLDSGVPASLDGTVQVTGLLARGLSPTPVGDFRAQFATTPEGIVGSIEDVAAMLDVAGSIRVRPERSYVLTGLVAPTATTPASVVDQLRFLGSPNERGQREFRFEGRF